jgi:hypothetical protein
MPNNSEALIANQFKPGHKPINNSRKGRPNFKTLYKRYLAQDFEVTKKDGVKVVLTAQDAIVLKTIENAIKYGDVNTVNMIMNRVDGMPVQTTKQLGKNPLQIIYTPKPVDDLTKEDNFESNIEQTKPEIAGKEND